MAASESPDPEQDDDQFEDYDDDELDEFDELNRSTATSTFLERPWFRRLAISFIGLIVLSFTLPILLPLFDGRTTTQRPEANVAGFPDFVLPSAAGGQVRLTDEAASHTIIVLVFHRGYDCAECRAQLVELQSGYRDLVAEGAELLTVGLDDQVDAERLAALARASFPVLYDPNGTVAKSYGVDDELAGEFTTTTLILDRSLNLATNPVGTIGDQLMPVTAIIAVLRDLNGSPTTSS